MLGELATTSAARVTEYKARKTRYDQRTFRRDEAEYATAEGWELVRENQNSDRYQKLKPHDEQLENEFWCLLYNLGYPNLNIGRSFQIEVTSNKRVTVSKQVDVSAYDNETILIAECKSCKKRTKRQLQKDLGDFIAHQKPIANTLRRFLQADFKQKVVWFFVTRNVEWSQPDLARAEEANIKIITEKDFFYYKEIAKRIGKAARYQFHAEFLANTKVHALERKVFAMRTKLGPHKAYTFFASADTILPIAFVNHRDLRDPNAAPSYQRLIHRPRLRDIAGYLANGGFFPNAIILNFKKKIRFDLLKPEDGHGITPGVMTLPDTYKSAWIIDGQHRLYGYTELGEDERSSHLPFLAFENISIPDETKIFADINSKQKNVSKKLLDEITGEIKLDATDKREQLRAIASRAFDLMRDDEDGPFGDKVAGAELKRGDGSILTIPYLVDATIISGLLGRLVVSSGSTTFVQGPLLWDDPREAITSLSELLSAYFDLFRVANSHRWNAGKMGKFATNVGAAALIRLLGDLISFMQAKDHEDPRDLHPKVIVEKIEKFVQPCLDYFKDVADNILEERFSVPFGGGGQRVFQHRLREIINKKFSIFVPPGFEEDVRKYDATRRQEADRKVRDIVEAVHRFVIARLRQVYGDKDNYLNLAVENKPILTRAFEKQVEVDPEKAKDLGTYLDFIDLRKIVETPKNWPHFKDELDISLPDEHANRKHTRWLDDINKLRRVVAHPYNRGYDDAEFEEIRLIYQALIERKLIVT